LRNGAAYLASILSFQRLPRYTSAGREGRQGGTPLDILGRRGLGNDRKRVWERSTSVTTTAGPDYDKTGGRGLFAPSRELMRHEGKKNLEKGKKKDGSRLSTQFGQVWFQGERTVEIIYFSPV